MLTAARCHVSRTTRMWPCRRGPAAKGMPSNPSTHYLPSVLPTPARCYKSDGDRRGATRPPARHCDCDCGQLWPTGANSVCLLCYYCLTVCPTEWAWDIRRTTTRHSAPRAPTGGRGPTCPGRIGGWGAARRRATRPLRGSTAFFTDMIAIDFKTKKSGGAGQPRGALARCTMRGKSGGRPPGALPAPK